MKRALRAGRILVRDERLPRWLLALLAFGVAPIPLFLDEIALVVGVGVVAALYRDVLRDAWGAA